MPSRTKATPKAPAGIPASTFVLDNGAYTIKAGYASTDAEQDHDILPECVEIPNALARTRDRKTYVGAQMNEISQWSEVTFRRPVERGQLVNWEAEKEIWDLSFFDEKTAQKEQYIKSPEDTTLILTEPPNTIPALQKNADEIAMEEYGFGGYMRTIGSSLNAYNDLHPLFEDKPQNSLSNLPMECLLVIDSGYSHTTITPLYNGRPLHRAIRRLDFGGKHLTNLLKEVISVRHFDLHQDTKIVNNIKEDVCFVSQSFKSDMEKTWKGNKSRLKPPPDIDSMDIDGQEDQDICIDYVLPDGYHLFRGFSRPHDPSASAARKRKLNASAPDSEVSMVLGNERFTIPEIIFTPSDIGSKQPSLADTIMQALATLPPLIQATMLANTLVVGGNAKIPGFVERLEQELRMLVRTEWCVRVRKMNDPVRSTWLGGVRMAARHRDIVKQYTITKEEYFEYGSAWVGRKMAVGAERMG